MIRVTRVPVLNQFLSKPAVRRDQLRWRLWRHHLPLLGMSGIAVVVLYATRPYSDVLSRASFATAYPAMVLLAITLATGPWNVLRKRPNPVSSDLRRDIGIWAGILGVVHTAVGQCVHLRGRPWLYYVYGAKEHHSFPVRHDLFGFSNYTGAIAVLLLIALLATSNDLSLRRLGRERWKKLQRWNYAVFAATALHAFGYQAIEKQHFPFVATIAGCVAAAGALQFAGVVARRRMQS